MIKKSIILKVNQSTTKNILKINQSYIFISLKMTLFFVKKKMIDFNHRIIKNYS